MFIFQNNHGTLLQTIIYLFVFIVHEFIAILQIYTKAIKTV